MQWSCAIATTVFRSRAQGCRSIDGILARTKCLAGNTVTLAEMYLMPIVTNQEWLISSRSR